MRSKHSSIKHHTALITGATSGLGKELAYFFAEKNLNLILTGRDEEQLNLIKADLQQKVHVDTLAVDLSQSSERKSINEMINKRKPDLIINNAGFGLYGKSIDLSHKKQLEMIEVNVSALVEISLHAAEVLKKHHSKGIILNISSSASFFPFPLFNVYSASKSFVNSFSQALDAELRSFGIRVLCACPGQIATHFRNRASEGRSQGTDWRTMSIDTAIFHLWKQIKNHKTLYIFDWRYRIGVWLFHLLPNRMREKILIKYIRNR